MRSEIATKGVKGGDDKVIKVGVSGKRRSRRRMRRKWRRKLKRGSWYEK